MEVTIHNNITSGKSLFVYIAGFTDPSGSQSMLQTDGSWALLSAGASITPIKIPFNVEFVVAPNSATTLTLPSYVNSSRLYAVEGASLPWAMVLGADGLTTVVQPVPTTPGTVAHDNRWGFVEFTSSADEFFVNLSFVDFVSLPMGIAATDSAGAAHSVPGLMQQLPGSAPAPNTTTTTSVTAANVTQQLCLDLDAQAQLDGLAWGALCVYSNTTTTDPATPQQLLRILSPQAATQQNKPFAPPDYYDAYIGAVWAHYTTNALHIDTQQPGLTTTTTPTTNGSSSIVTCQVDAATDALVCDGTPVRMARPATADVWGCSGGAFALAADDAVFKAVVPRVCAALTRSTLLLLGGGGGDTQPGPAVASFYNASVTNHYARVVHGREVVGGYAFAYDDVACAGADQDGAIQVASLETLEVYIGG